ncbi:hypothetical protein FJV41_36385 [Myxococcus llanfairpwllgwyngyllgogerychwyrndrobwllllantysiliogogogochensis]|nr:hypothetical protein [Myxococcus llanfairpwllgwyngyllgogerychwyrndrobwllllantysiliogogogochensis]TQF11032.1 hypothetical protein FJV41_36385 [Myxococcus llanfairpwllgwyngyllgogerychwyrndrobwllllantysiliogogogochensis]
MVIGSSTTYIGDEIPGLKGQQVRIFAVLHGGLSPDADPDDAGFYVRLNETLERLGGVTEVDCLDIAPILPGGKSSFVHYDARPMDLECFAHLRNPSAQ